MTKAYFITGTDTSAGKTWCTVALMQYFKNQGQRVLAMKPIASGCNNIDGRLRNEDALILQQHASQAIAYDEINPYAFKMPVSPHIAAKQHNKEIDLQVITEQCQTLQNKTDVLLVEGVGGWLVPLSENLTVQDMAIALGLPVILVVGIKLGCLNHALLSYQAIQSSGLQLAGWIANCNSPDMDCMQENIATLDAMIKAPRIAAMPYCTELDLDLMAGRVHW